jgi:hypothetical protein
MKPMAARKSGSEERWQIAYVAREMYMSLPPPPKASIWGATRRFPKMKGQQCRGRGEVVRDCIDIVEPFRTVHARSLFLFDKVR